jgi:hypothetical protein
VATWFPDDMDPDAVANAAFEQRRRIGLISVGAAGIGYVLTFAIHPDWLRMRAAMAILMILVPLAGLAAAALLVLGVLRMRRAGFVASAKAMIEDGRRIPKITRGMEFACGLAAVVLSTIMWSVVLAPFFEQLAESR